MGLGLVTVVSGPGEGFLAGCGAAVHIVAVPATAAAVFKEEALCCGEECARKAVRKPPRKDGLCVGILVDV